MLNFSNSGKASGPWARLDGRTGQMIISSPDGERQTVTLTGKVLAFNFCAAVQGWLLIKAASADWQPIEDGNFGNPPSGDHKKGVELPIYSATAFGDQPVRVARGNSVAWNGFIKEIYERSKAVVENGEAPANRWPTIKVNSVTIVKIGKGSSVAFDFTLAPVEKWASPEVASAPAKAAPVAKTAVMADEEF